MKQRICGWTTLQQVHAALLHKPNKNCVSKSTQSPLPAPRSLSESKELKGIFITKIIAFITFIFDYVLITTFFCCSTNVQLSV